MDGKGIITLRIYSKDMPTTRLKRPQRCEDYQKETNDLASFLAFAPQSHINRPAFPDRLPKNLAGAFATGTHYFLVTINFPP